MSGADLGCDADEGPDEILESQPFHVLLHALCQAHAAEQTIAAKVDVEKAEDTAFREAPRELFQGIELAGKIAAADQGADGCAGDHIDLDAGFVDGAQYANMPPTARCAA